MPYNTRRKSLSLSELGIIVPKRSRTQSHPSPPSTIAEGDEPAAKKTKRSHASSTSPSPGLMSPPRTTTIRIKEDGPRLVGQLSPPPSPAAEGRSNKVDVEGINDDVVVGTIQQLESTGNRPHLLTELATVLATRLRSVEESKNPSALISSRLTSYLNRSWPALSPCPLAKYHASVHPRRLYFYLTTLPQQPISHTIEQRMQQHRIISPSLSSASAADEEDEKYSRSRHTLSPSPEVDLSSPELDEASTQEPPTPGAPFSGRTSVTRERSLSTSDMTHHRRAASPQLEHEERDFKQTANALYEQAQLRRRSTELSQQDVQMDTTDAVAGAEQEVVSVTLSTEPSDHNSGLQHHDDPSTLFGQSDHLGVAVLPMEFSSPILQPQNPLRIDTISARIERNDGPVEQATLAIDHTSRDIPMLTDLSHIQSPESVELAELEDMFDDF